MRPIAVVGKTDPGWLLMSLNSFIEDITLSSIATIPQRRHFPMVER